MRLAIEQSGYAAAADAFAGGNRYAAASLADLTGKLAGCAGMAGDDCTSTEFAASYDEAARSCVAALADLVAAFASLADLAAGSLDNHRAAESHSAGRGGAPAGDDHASTPDTVAVAASSPPSALGAGGSSYPGWAGWVVHLVEGFVWPNADTDRLRTAGAAWRTAADGVGLLSSYCDGAREALGRELSPEIPLALDATEDLRSRAQQLVPEFLAVASACESYADQVEEKRAAMVRLLAELAKELAAGAVVAGALSLVSGGLAAGAGSAAAGSRIGAAARELQAIVDALRIVAGGTAGTLRPVTATATETSAALGRFRVSRLIAQMEDGGPGLGQASPRWPHGWLRSHEHPPGHTIARHVGKGDAELLVRLFRERQLRFASSFPDEGTAERAIRSVLDKHQHQIREWLSRPGRPLRIEDKMNYVVGRTATRTGEVFDVRGVRVVLVHDPAMPEAYRVLTSYPLP